MLPVVSARCSRAGCGCGARVWPPGPKRGVPTPMSRFLIPLLLVIVISPQGQAQRSSSAQPPVAVIRAGVLVDPESGTAARNQTILVENGRVTAVGADVSIPAGAAVID